MKQITIEEIIEHHKLHNQYISYYEVLTKHIADMMNAKYFNGDAIYQKTLDELPENITNLFQGLISQYKDTLTEYRNKPRYTFKVWFKELWK